MINNEINVKKRISRRLFKERLFRFSGILSISFAMIMLCYLLFSIFIKGYTAFYTHHLQLDLNFSQEALFQDNIKDHYSDSDIRDASYEEIVTNAIKNDLLSKGQDITILNEVDLFSFVSINGKDNLIDIITNDTSVLNTNQETNLLVTSDVDMYLKSYIDVGSILNDKEVQVIELLRENNIIKPKFNTFFFTNADSRYPELAGIKGAFFGTFYTVLLTVTFAVFISIGAAIFLQEFAPKNKFISFIEVNINNLAAVPSVVFGLLGLAVFQQFFGFPRSTPLLASLVLTSMALPIIVISTRIAMSAVPISIKEASFSLGSSKLQYIIYHLIPNAFSGILTGIILSIARVIGETAPVLMIGMFAFVNTVPTSPLSSSAVFPVQILLWSSSPEAGYIEKSSAAIILLLIFLMTINGLSIYFRNKFESKF